MNVHAEFADATGPTIRSFYSRVLELAYGAVQGNYVLDCTREEKREPQDGDGRRGVALTAPRHRILAIWRLIPDGARGADVPADSPCRDVDLRTQWI